MKIISCALETEWSTMDEYTLYYWYLGKKKGKLYWIFDAAIDAEETDKRDGGESILIRNDKIQDFVDQIPPDMIFLGTFKQRYAPIKCTKEHLRALGHENNRL